MARHRLAALALAIGLAAAASTPSDAAVVLDQDVSGLLNTAARMSQVGDIEMRRAQTFTVGYSGNLIQVDIRLFQVGGLTEFAGMNVLATSQGAATPTILATGVYRGEVAGYAQFGISPLAVQAGDVLAIEPIIIASPFFNWGGTNADIYAGGGDQIATPANSPTFSNTGTERHFRTWVADARPSPQPVPEPDAAALLLAGLGALLTLRQGLLPRRA
jgi:hypothetical protein